MRAPVRSAEARTDLVTKTDLAQLTSDLRWRLVLMTGACLAALTALLLLA